MQFENKIQRARRAQRQALGLDQPEAEQARRSGEMPKLERGDLFAMLFSAFCTLFLPCVLVLVGMVLLVAWMLGAFSEFAAIFLPIVGALIAAALLVLLLLKLFSKKK